ncbi:unnamed protein product [Lupinus luteus]|uniref:RING-type E3 ubiquitin transferase n=1 Tax=Lupinus luteus TaxID=3873 RepID=A0AAV1YD40_LUPLU
MSLRGLVSLFFNLIGLDTPLPCMLPSTINISESASSLSNFMENVEGGQCCVCLSKLSNKDEIRVLPCMHEFHKICVNKWLKGHQKTCPLCRFSIGAKEKSHHHRSEMFTEEMLIWFSSFHIAGECVKGAIIFACFRARDLAADSRFLIIRLFFLSPRLRFGGSVNPLVSKHGKEAVQFKLSNGGVVVVLL